MEMEILAGLSSFALDYPDMMDLKKIFNNP